MNRILRAAIFICLRAVWAARQKKSPIAVTIVGTNGRVTLPTSVVESKLYAQQTIEQSFVYETTRLSRTLWSISLLTILYLLSQAIYNVWFHPLRLFPGPILARSSLLWRLFNTTTGRVHLNMQKQHQIYGTVVRVSPNELSFASVGSYKTIYNHHVGRPDFIKSEFYEVFGAGFKSLCIGSERNVKRHAQMKRNLAGAFSTKALHEQEYIVDGAINGFIEKLALEGKGGRKPVNATQWFEMITFDILGEMAFGQSFGSIESGERHFWPSLILDHMSAINVADNLRRVPLLAAIGRLLSPIMAASQNKHTGFVREKVASRLANPSDRKDFFSNLASKVESGEVELEEMTAHASTLIIAGGETSAAFLCAATFYLLTNPSTYDALRKEIRTTFASYDDINATRAQQLPYLAAVINEGLRMYPPGSQGFARISPGAEVDGYWVPQGTEVYTSPFSVVRDEANFHNANAFVPERWLESAANTAYANDTKEASQPFSLGPRGCLGRNFAYMEIFLLMAKLHWKYDLELEDPYMDFEGKSRCNIMWTKPDLFVRFKDRLMMV